jgi:hypothetical protein
MSTAAPPKQPVRALNLPLYPAGRVPGTTLTQAHNLANQLASLEAQKGTQQMGTQSSRGGRTRRVFKKKRLMSRAYCKKTPCKRMGFTQKASCRPYKNCYTRKK